jgi:hypothetical protein
MELLKNLTKGIEILEPFLKEYGFELDDYDIEKNAEGHFTAVIYRNERKKFIIDYRFSIGQVLYAYDNSAASHPFYLDNLGFADKKHKKDFLSDHNLEVFEDILYDFEYLIHDFFKGDCSELKEIAALKDNTIQEVDRKVRKENSIRIDTIRIEKAREEFRIKELKKCLECYRFVDHRDLLAELDNKIIEYCKRNT